MRNSEEEEPLQNRGYNMLILGDPNVGKTSLCARLTKGNFPLTVGTVGVQFASKAVGNKTLRFFDVAGDGDKRGQVLDFLPPIVHAVILVCDLSNLSTADSLRTRWLPLIREKGLERPLLIVGNKDDLISAELKAEHALADVAHFAVECGCQVLSFMHTSAKTGLNVDKVFVKLCAEITELERESPQQQTKCCQCHCHCGCCCCTIV